MKKYLSFLLIFLILFAGCSSGVKPMRNSQLKGYSGPPPTIVYTNTVQLVNPAQTNKITIPFPITLSKPPASTNLEDVQVTIPKTIDVNVNLSNSTNMVTLSGEVIKEKNLWLSPAAFLYFFVLIGAVLLVVYMWNKKPKGLKAAMKEAEKNAKTTTIVPAAKVTETTEEIKVVPSTPITPTIIKMK